VAEARALGAFNAMGPASTTTMKAMVDGIAKGIGSTARPVWVPTSFLDEQKVAAWSDMPVWIPAQGDTAGASLRSNARAIRTGLTFRPLGATAKDTLAWFRTLPADRQKGLRAGIKPEREQQVLAAWAARTKKG
jgi:2'-hydroxyisoflavone reductase